MTSFGKIADPIADKALTLSAFVLLSINDRLWWWVTILIVVRELGITVMRFFMLRRAVMAASRGGKIKTTLQMWGWWGCSLRGPSSSCPQVWPRSCSRRLTSSWLRHSSSPW